MQPPQIFTLFDTVAPAPIHVLLAGHGKGVDLLVAHDLPRLAQAGRAGDAGDLPVIHVPNFRVDIGAHPGRRDPELFQHEFCFLIHLARTPGFADQITGLVFQLCIGNGRADGVGVRVAVPDDHDLVRSLLHSLPPYGSSTSYHISYHLPDSAPLLHSGAGCNLILTQLCPGVKGNKRLDLTGKLL